MPSLQICPHCGVRSTKPTAKFCSHCGQALPASIQSVGADQPLLHTILAEIQSLRGEIVALRSALTDQAQQRITPPQMPTLAAPTEPLPTTESGAATPQRLLEWLTARKISVKEQRQPEAADSVFDELALFFGRTLSDAAPIARHDPQTSWLRHEFFAQHEQSQPGGDRQYHSIL